MRSVTAAELLTLAELERVVTPRVKVANGSGTMIDLSKLFHGGTIDHDVDQPVGGAGIAFRRDQGATQSLSPLRTDSTLNVNDVGAYSPLLDLKRAVTVEVATTNIGAALVAGDYKMLFKGTIDRVRFERSPIAIECRDLGAPLVDRWVETEKFYSTVGGEPIQDVMQDILDDVFGAGVVPLYVPVDPLYNINKYFQKRMSVMGALTELMQLRGLDVRYRWDDGTSAFRLTLTEPPRSKTVPDHTFTPSKYFEITNLDIENLGIKNAIAGSFRDSTDMGNRNDPIVVTDGPSITKYDRQYFLIQEGDDSPIDTPSEMTTMLNYALADLKEPKASQGVEAPLFWPADISDLYRYPDNRVHFNTDQDFAVRGFTHELGQKRHRTIFKVGGTVIGQYNTWLGRGGTIGGTGTAFPPVPRIIPLNTESDDATWDLQFTSTNGSGGGGSNLTYSIKSKKYFGGESTIDTGTGADLPDTEVIVRDPRDDQIITFEVTDAATGMVAAETFVVPSYLLAIKTTGMIDADSIDDGSTLRAVPLAELPAGTQAKTLIISSAAFQPGSTASTYVHGSDGLTTVSGSGVFFAFAPLPQGVTITKIEMWSKNPTGGGSSDVILRLYRQSASAFGSATLIATATRTAVASDGGGMDASSTVSEAVTTNTYVLRVDLGDNLDLFLNAIVYYTMPSYDKTL